MQIVAVKTTAYTQVIHYRTAILARINYLSDIGWFL